MASKKINLDQLDIYSNDAERLSNAIKRVIQFSDTEDKLFSCFDWYRDQAGAKDRAQWDKCFDQFVKRELFRTGVAQDFTLTAMAEMEKKVLRVKPQKPAEQDDTGARKQLDNFIKNTRVASKVDNITEYADMIKAGHDEAVFLGHVMDALWKHQAKHQAILEDTAGHAQMSLADVRVRKRDFARYLDSRAKWIGIEAEQAVWKARLEVNAKTRRKAKKREKKMKAATTGNESHSET